MVEGLGWREGDESGISGKGVSLFSGGLGGPAPRLDTPPSINRRHPYSGLALKRLAFCLIERGFVRPSIGQTLSDDALKQFARALWIADAKSRASIVPKIELGQIHRQMFMRDVVIHAIDAAVLSENHIRT